jgi:hypothetical protein
MPADERSGRRRCLLRDYFSAAIGRLTDLNLAKVRVDTPMTVSTDPKFKRHADLVSTEQFRLATVDVKSPASTSHLRAGFCAALLEPLRVRSAFYDLERPMLSAQTMACTTRSAASSAASSAIREPQRTRSRIAGRPCSSTPLLIVTDDNHDD